MNESTPLVGVERASVVRTGRALLNDISFNLHAGQVMALLGANGAGKSTLLSALAGEATLSSGEILLNGVSLNRFTPQALAEIRALNAVEPPLAFSLSVFEYVSLGQPFADVDCAAILEALERCHATQWMNRDAASLSLGELLRVQLARSLFQLSGARQCLWLLDEPLAHLDLAQRQFALNLMRDIAKERQWAVVFSTHDPRDAIAIADYALMLKEARVFAQGATSDVLSEASVNVCFGLREAL
jgi:iron complex transport system ATP-binding protein